MSRRPRAVCPWCGRDTATTRTGRPWAHNTPAGQRCHPLPLTRHPDLPHRYRGRPITNILETL